MDEYISRQAVLNKINERQRKLIYCFGFENDAVKIMDIAKSIVIAMPSAQPELESADVASVVHAYWIQTSAEDEDGNAYYSCSNCGSGESHNPIVEVPYCWKCGAKMDEYGEG